MKIITISGPPSSGKTATIVKTIIPEKPSGY